MWEQSTRDRSAWRVSEAHGAEVQVEGSGLGVGVEVHTGETTLGGLAQNVSQKQLAASGADRRRIHEQGGELARGRLTLEEAEADDLAFDLGDPHPAGPAIGDAVGQLCSA